MIDLAELAKRGLTLIYGPPGAGKTSIAIRLASRLGSRVLWISTTEGPDAFDAAVKRLGAPKEAFDFYDFPRAFRESVAKYAADRLDKYGALVVDSVTGLAEGELELEKTGHSFFYQIAKNKPVILTAEGGPGKLAYIADHVIKVSAKLNSIGHLVRKLQLVKSRYAPPTEPYIFDIIEGAGLGFVYTKRMPGSEPPIQASDFGEIPRGSTIGIFGLEEDKVIDKLAELTEGKDVVAAYIPGAIMLKKMLYRAGLGQRVHPLATFHDLMYLLHKIATGQEKADVIVFSGLAIVNRLNPVDLVDYLRVLGAFEDYVEYRIIADLISEKEVMKSPLHEGVDYRIFL